MQMQLPPSQSFQQHHLSSTHARSITSNNSSSSSPYDYSSHHPSRSTAEDGQDGDMNPYQQYPGYGQQPQQPGTAASQQQQQHQQSQRSYMPNQLPPLGPGMGPSSMGMPPHPSYMGPQQTPMAQQPTGLGTPSTRSGASNPPQERKMASSTTKDGLRYTLDVVQQPQRARMCGFGDKDRRPITPPPCVRLIITDVETGTEIEMSEIRSDPSFFVLQVDLWAEHADREANVVRASSNSPAVSISSATTTSYPPPAEHPRMANEGQHVVYMNPDGQPIYATVPGYAVPLARPMPPSQFGPGLYYSHMPQAQSMQQFMPPTQSNSAMYTRNLIGSLTVNASQLKDNDGKPGYWFVLQDLSVRTEGFFRLRMSFIDISNHGAPGVNRGKAPVLAWTFSEVFQVYSAKKFPGVIESTPLSKTFASQGIKIPIRKDNKNDAQDDDDGD